MAKNHRPSPPTDQRLNGKAASGEMSTRDLRTVQVSAVIDDPDKGQKVQLVAYYSHNNFKTYKVVHSEFGPQNRRETLNLSGLAANTRYQVRLYTRDRGMLLSKSYAGITFWTNRPPSVAVVKPTENSEFAQGQTVFFDWTFTDPDEGDSQTQFQFRFRASNESTWHYIPTNSKHQPSWFTGNAGKNTFLSVPTTGRFRSNTNYYWSVRVRDEAKVASDWSVYQSFFVRGTSTPPRLIAPVGGTGRAVIATRPYLFTWEFRDPTPAAKQRQADIRWRVVGTGDVGADDDVGWFMRVGSDVGGPNTNEQWEIPEGSFQPGFVYEWQVRTYSNQAGELPSGWSSSGIFTATGEPGGLVVDDPIATDDPQPLGSLGCGNHRVFIYYRGGKVRVGEIKPLANVQWSRLRDDISNALITTNGFGADCCELLGSLRSWIHEVVIYRDNDRVFEGPITRITYTATDVEIEAKDVMAYLYRRIMRQGYDDRYQRLDLNPKTKPEPLPSTKGGPYTIIGKNTVVERAMQIAVNALAYQDPNVLGYLTPIQFSDDATEQRLVYDYGKTAWEEIDDMAATAGLDYCTVGRRILFWDTHRAIGRLPEMRDGDFQDPVIVTEYGMQTSNFYAVTNNSGIYGAAYPLDHDGSDWYEAYGPVEMLSSAYSENTASSLSTESLNATAISKLQASFKKQAQKGIANRWPTPVVARVPDNSRLNPDVDVTIQQLIPGVWIPLRATLTCRNVQQWQKLDSITVTQEAGVETVQVTMSPAPHGGDDDPDLSGQAEAD